MKRKQVVITEFSNTDNFTSSARKNGLTKAKKRKNSAAGSKLKSSIGRKCKLQV